MQHNKSNFKRTTPLAWLAGVVAVTATVLGAQAAIAAWGPERETFTIEKPASFITFNSLTNNQAHGDERNFVQAKPASHLVAGGWKDEVEVTKDEEFLVRVYVHNNAAANLNLISENTRVKVAIPTETGEQGQLGAWITSDNATPKEVWDDVVFKSAGAKFNMAYVAGSARYYTNYQLEHGPKDGFVVNDSLVTKDGALIGYDKLDGKIQGCYQYSGILSFKVKAQTQKIANFAIEKKVRKHGDKNWSTEPIKVKPGELIDYQISYKNIGQVAQNNVIATDILPKFVDYKADTTTLKNSANPEGDGLKLTEGQRIVENGINIGNYNPGANAFVRFTAEAPQYDELELCGLNVYRNVAVVHTEHGKLVDSIDIHVEKDNCEKPITPDVPTEPTTEPEVPVNPDPQPEAPKELPKTGPAEAIVSAITIFVIAASVAYWYKSQQELAALGPKGKRLTIKEVKTKTIKDEVAKGDQ